MQAGPSRIQSTSDSSTLNAVYLALAEHMNEQSASWNWLNQIKTDTIKSWKTLLKSAFITSTMFSWREVDEKIDNFNEEQRNMWKEATRRGVETGDWTDFINHSVTFGLSISPFVLKQSNRKEGKSTTTE